jgi:hypothetical protein
MQARIGGELLQQLSCFVLAMVDQPTVFTS